MDLHAHAWTRAGLMSVATAGILASELFAAQETPVPTAVPPAKIQVAGGDVDLAQSEIEQQLRQLYERDGRQMPDLKLTPATSPAVQPQGRPPAGPAAPRTQQPRYSTAPPMKAPKPSPNKVTSFFKRMMPGSNPKKTQAAQPLRQLPPVPPQAPSYQPLQPNAVQPVLQPQIAQPSAPVRGPYVPVSSAPAPAQPQVVTLPPSPAATETPVRTSTPVAVPAAQAVPVATSPQTAPAAAAQLPQLITLPEPAAEEEFFAPEMQEETLELPAAPVEVASPPQAEAMPEEVAAPRLTDDFPDPFGDAAQTPVSEDAETNPFLGKSLDEQDEPAPLPDSPSLLPVVTVVKTPIDDATAVKMRRVIQRADMKGLKGFCPVTLRDQRELADSKAEFAGTFRGQRFYFASKVAQAKFEEDPARYAPAAYGADVVVLTTLQDVVEGTLDYAAWYKGRLYLFGSQQTHDMFVTDPDKYATPPGIE